MEQLTCCDCGNTWTRELKTGGKPPRCPDCKRKHLNAKSRARHKQKSPRHCFDCGDQLGPLVNKRGSDGNLRCSDCGKKRRLKPRSDLPGSKNRITCKQCGNKLSGNQRYWCKKFCSEVFRGQRRAGPREPRICAVCSAEFVPNSDGQLTCPPSQREKQRASNPITATSWCHRRYYRYKTGEIDDPAGVPPKPFNCLGCQRSCIPGEDGVHLTARKFCGKPTCKSKHFAQRKRHGCTKDQWLILGGPICKLKDRPKSRQFIVSGCLECGKAIVWAEQSNPAKYCQASCKRKPANRRRRIRFQEAFVEHVHLWEVANRAEFRCGICSGLTDLSLGPNQPGSPTVDHIVPLAFGGEHSYANAQLAHHYCNSVKGAFEAHVLRQLPELTKPKAQEWVKYALWKWRNNPDSVTEIMGRGGGLPPKKTTITGLGGISGSVRIPTSAQGLRPLPHGQS